MTDEQKGMQAKLAYQTFCDALDRNEWKYKKNNEKMTIECGAQGEDLPMEFSISADADRQLLVLLSHLPFVIAEDKRIDTAAAICVVNNFLVDGCFDFDVGSGHMFFRITNSFFDSVMSEDVCTELLYKACQTIDEYNDKFLMVGKGILSVEKFLELVTNQGGETT